MEFTARYAKSDRNKERGGISLRTTIRITDNAGAPAPLQLTNTTLRFPKGAVVNARFFPKCNPAALRQRGPRACPGGSKIGSGTAIGLAPPIVHGPREREGHALQRDAGGPQPDASSSMRSPTSAR